MRRFNKSSHTTKEGQPVGRLALGPVLAAMLLSGCGGGAGTGSVSGVDAQGGTQVLAATPTTSTTAASSMLGAPAPPPPPPPALPALGAPVAGLTAAQVAAFNDGKADFEHAEDPTTGLGPIFNGRSCAECHAGGATGGGSGRFVTRFGKTTNGTFDAMASLGGSLLQSFALRGTPVEKVPTTANTVTARRTTALWGLGLIEAIPDADIVAEAARQVAKRSKIAGQVVTVTSAADGKQHVGRFGWKCQQASVLDFSGDAYMNEMGISNELFPAENSSNGPQVAVAKANLEDKLDTKTGLRDIDRAASFMRLLAQPPNPVVAADSLNLPPTSPVARGAQLFTTVGCQECHRPFFNTISPVAALNRKKSWAFSDWLIHDIGTGDGIVQGSAPGSKIRTAPLMDIAHVTAFLHDGTAATVQDAINRHAGEAADVTAAYKKLSAADQAALVSFVRSL